MRKRRRIKAEYHDGLRGLFRLLGPAMVMTGGVFVVIGFADFFGTMDGGGEPTKFWMLFVGGPLLAFGIGVCRAGYMGALARYAAAETAPVATDTINYVVDGTKEAVGDMVEAIRGDKDGTACPQCNAENDADARFCDNCGTALAIACASCGKTNDRDAAFCDGCGAKLS